MQHFEEQYALCFYLGEQCSSQPPYCLLIMSPQETG